MCGLVGLAGKLEFKDEATMKRLLLIDYFRGTDSTGFAAYKNNGDHPIVKLASHPLDLFDMTKFKESLSGTQSKVFLGHNRAATKGKVNAVNAHPFQFEHIIGAHNGTLEWSSVSKLEKLTGEKYDVDSQAIFHAISVAGIEAVAPLLKGAWALTWFDLSNNTLNFLRNKERPFWIAYSEKFDKVMWASEHPILRAALELSATGYDLYKTAEGHGFFQTKVDWWYRYDLDALKKGFEARPKPRVKELKGEEPSPAVNNNCGGGYPFHHRQNETNVTPIGSRTPTTTTTTHGGTGVPNTITGSTIPEILLVEGTDTDPFGGFISKERFDVLTERGCSWCGSPVSFEQRGIIVMDYQDKIIGPCCSDEIEKSRVYTFGNKILAHINEQANKEGKAA